MSICVGERVRLSATFKRSGQPAIPSMPVNIIVRRRAKGAETEGPWIAVAIEDHVFEHLYTPQAPGVYDWRVTTADGGIEEGSFVVEKSRLD